MSLLVSHHGKHVVEGRHALRNGALCDLALLIPGLNFLVILGGLFGFYLLRTGLPLLMHAPDNRALRYAVIVTAGALIPALVLSMI